MTIHRSSRLLGVVALLSSAMVLAAHSAVNSTSTIKIGEINSYKAQPELLEPYRMGMELAVAQINATGGINGKRLELIVRDDNGNSSEAVRVAQELLVREKVEVLAGSSFSHIGLALTDFAQQKKVFFLASEALTDKITWQHGNRYTYRLRASVYMQVAMLVPEAVKMKGKRWALVYPHHEYGQSAAITFKQLLKAAQPDVEFVAEQAVSPGRPDIGVVVQALAEARPDALFNVLSGADLVRLVREGSSRGLFQGRRVVSLLSGEPEHLDALGGTTPNGWVVTGYPWYDVDAPEYKAFLIAYQVKYQDYPRLSSVVGYTTIKALAEGMKKAQSCDTEQLIRAFKGLQVISPFGPIIFRPQDNQSTLGAFVGKLRNQGGKGIMIDHYYVDGAKVQPSDAVVKRLRPTEN